MARLPGNTMIPGGDEENPCVALLLETAFNIGMNMKAGTDCDFNLMVMMSDGLMGKNLNCSEAGYGGLKPEVEQARDKLVEHVHEVGERIFGRVSPTVGRGDDATAKECLTTSNLFDELAVSLGIILPGQSISRDVNGQRPRTGLGG